PRLAAGGARRLRLPSLGLQGHARVAQQPVLGAPGVLREVSLVGHFTHRPSSWPASAEDVGVAALTATCRVFGRVRSGLLRYRARLRRPLRRPPPAAKQAAPETRSAGEQTPSRAGGCVQPVG